MMLRILNCAALLLAFACCAGAFAQGKEGRDPYIGHKFWYEPEHEKYSRTEFHHVPDFDKGVFYIEKKTRFEVLALGRGWFKLHLEGPFNDPIAYVPARILRLRLYAPKITESYQESFRKASIFEEDPAAIRKRLERVNPELKSTAPPPWKIRNRGFPPPRSQPPVEEEPAETAPKE